MAILRLDKIVADAGIASRREVKALVRDCRITVNGVTAAASDIKCSTDSDVIAVDGEPVLHAPMRYIMLNKPAGAVSATEDPNERTVLDLLGERERRQRLFPVGRLDKDTEGLLLLTNDGGFSHAVTAPKKEVVKVYYAETVPQFETGDVKIFGKGIRLKDGLCRPAGLEILERGAMISISEGRYHQVKRMAAYCGKEVKYLKRISIGGLRLDESLLPGQWRELSEEEKLSVFR